MLGQYEAFDAGDWVSWDFSDYGVIDYGLVWDMPDYSAWDMPTYEIPDYTEMAFYGDELISEWPSEARFIETYQAQQEAIQANVQGSGLLDAFKAILGVATPVAVAAMRADQKPAATTLPWTSYLPQTSSGEAFVQSASIGGAISSLTSSPILLLALGLGGFMLLRKGKKRPQEIEAEIVER